LRLRDAKNQTTRRPRGGGSDTGQNTERKFFAESKHQQRFEAATLLKELATACHPLDLALSARAMHMRSLKPEQRREVLDSYARSWAAASRGVTALCTRLRPILDRPHDAALRLIDPKDPPLARALSASAKFAERLPHFCAFLGLEKPSTLYLWRHTGEDSFLLSAMENLETELVNQTVQVTEQTGAAQSRVSSRGSSRHTSRNTAERLGDQSLLETAKLREQQEYLDSMNTPDRREYELREARLRQSMAQPTVHDRFAASFRQKSSFEPLNPLTQLQRPLSPAEIPARTRGIKTRGLGVSGVMRAPDPVLSYHQSSATAIRNEAYVAAESSAGIKSRTASTFTTATSAFPSFVFLPAMADFGMIKTGVTYRMTCVLANKGHTSSRFQIQQPDQVPGVHLRVLYRPGMVAPGLERRMEIELCVMAEGVVNGDVTLRTEKHAFRLPIRASVSAENPTGTLAKSAKFGRIGQVRVFELSPPRAMTPQSRPSSKSGTPRQTGDDLSDAPRVKRSDSLPPAERPSSGPSSRRGSAGKARNTRASPPMDGQL
jgi:hypothetical protein